MGDATTGTPAVSPDQVAVYIRWSTDEQGDGTTLGVQLETCRHYLLSQGWAFRPELVYVDDGCSGGSLERSALTALRQAVQQGRVGCVVTYKLDRLSRSLLDTVHLVLREWEGRCHYKSAREPIDTTTPTGRMFFYILASYAEWERALICERLFSGKRARARQGRNPGMKAPYGFRPGSEPGTFAVSEPEAAVVRRLYADYLRGKSSRTLAEELTRAGVPSPEGRAWGQNTILAILRNEAYAGVLAYGRTTRVRSGPAAGTRRHAQPRYARVEGAWPSIVSSATWRQVQVVLAARGARRQRRSQYLLSGIARCRCGAALVGSQADPAHRYYYCARARQAGAAGCSCGAIPGPALEEQVAAVVQTHCGLGTGEDALAVLRAELTAAAAGLTAGLGAVAGGLSDLDRRLARMRTDYEAGDLPARLYATHVAAGQEERQRLRRRRVALQAELQQLYRRRRHLAGARDRIQALAARVCAWDYLAVEERKQWLRHLVERLVVWRAPGRRGAGTPVEVELTLRTDGTEPAGGDGTGQVPDPHSGALRAQPGRGEQGQADRRRRLAAGHPPSAGRA